MPSKTLSQRPRLASMLTITISAMVLITVLALVGLIDYFARNYAQRQAAVRLQQIAWQMKGSLERRMAYAIGDIRLLSDSVDVRTAGTAAEMRRALENLQRKTPDYAWIGMAALDGRVFAATGKLLEGEDVSARPWFQGTRSSVQVFDYHPAVLLGKSLPAAEEPWRFVDVAIPVTGTDGELRGILGAHLSWDWARKLAATLLAPAHDEFHTEILVVRKDGMVILGPKEMVESRMASKSLELAWKGSSGTVDERFNARRYLTGYAQTGSHDQQPGLTWAVLVRQPYDVALADFHRLQQHISIAGLALALLLGYAGVRFAGRMARPLYQLSTALEQHGFDRAAPVPVISDFHEVHLLSSTLAATLEREESHLAALRGMNESLESTVRERTAEIAAKAELLQRALDSQQQSQLQLQEREAELRTTLQNANDAFIAVDEHGIVLEWNEQAERLLGWSHGEACGRSLPELIFDEELAAEWRRSIRDYLLTRVSNLVRQRVEIGVKRRDGADITVEISMAHVPRRQGHLFIAFMHDISERKLLQATLEGMALRDTLTDLPNRRALMQKLPEALARSDRIGRPLAVFFMDLDGFKGVNDSHGHEAGDELLRILAQRILGTVRRTDTVARLAGDEFVVLLEMLYSADDAIEVAGKLLPVLAQGFTLKSATVALSGSIGIALHAPGARETPEQLLARADAAMYAAKNSGKNRYAVAEG